MSYGDFDGTMTTEQLAVELDWFCGCGQPEGAAKSLLELLEMFPLYNSQQEFQNWMPTDWGQRYLFLYAIDHIAEWIEHGGSVGGSWLTPRGEAVRAALRREQKSDVFESLFDMRCVHGFLFDSDHDCSAVEDESESGPTLACGQENESTGSSHKSESNPKGEQETQETKLEKGEG